MAEEIVVPAGNINPVVPDACATADMVKPIIEVRQRRVGSVEIDDGRHVIGGVMPESPNALLLSLLKLHPKRVRDVNPLISEDKRQESKY